MVDSENYDFYEKGADSFPTAGSDFFSLKATDIDGKDFEFSALKVKRGTLVINVASACGFTKPNYTQLNTLYEALKDKGLEILAFPCNQFDAQESACEADIKKFVQEKYQVKYPFFAKIDVNGENTHPVYQFLRSNAPELKTEAGANYIPWNFAKFFVDSKGNVNFFNPHIDPKDLQKTIEERLN